MPHHLKQARRGWPSGSTGAAPSRRCCGATRPTATGCCAWSAPTAPWRRSPASCGRPPRRPRRRLPGWRLTPARQTGCQTGAGQRPRRLPGWRLAPARQTGCQTGAGQRPRRLPRHSAPASSRGSWTSARSSGWSPWQLSRAAVCP
ncbi:unnamed protein product [Prorocentrum cordatum]|uniref:Uncharacterized protein n=1 Tax=Prorocentrum cordatum TaxID=2364126 RepID=A0ABN9VWY8_9DINO|nr:unnamed protein product [Polarella glacialis]